MTTVILTVLSVFLHDDTEISYFPPLSSSVDLEGGRNLVHRSALNALSHINQENFALCDSMVDLENIMLSEISQSEEDKYYII